MLKKISDIHVPLAHSLSDRHAHGNKEPLHPICLSLSRPVHSSPPTRASVTNEQTRTSVPKSVPEFFPHSFVEEKGRGGEALHYNQLGPLWVIIPLVFFGWFLSWSWRIHKDRATCYSSATLPRFLLAKKAEDIHSKRAVKAS